MKTAKLRTLLLPALLALCLTLSGCYSIFSGGTGGRVVDAESTGTPKAGIADVEVYAFMSSRDRDAAYNKLKKNTADPLSGIYHAHTTTDGDGRFTISRLLWKSAFPDFWRDGDAETAYFLYYHEDYGVVKGSSSLIVSDSTSNTAYQELTAVKQRTALVLSVIDVANNQPTNKTMNVEVTVDDKVYKQTITGTGTVAISYMRNTTPEVSVTFKESAQKPSFKMCKDGTGDDWSFDETAQTITGVSGDSYSASVYGKKSIVNPVFSGKASAGDGVEVVLKYGDEVIDTTYTSYRILGDTVEHGYYSGLGNGYEWETGDYAEKTVKRGFTVNGNTVIVSSSQPNVVKNLP